MRATLEVEVQDDEFAVSQVAQTSLRCIIGESELDDLLAKQAGPDWSGDRCSTAAGALPRSLN